MKQTREFTKLEIDLEKGIFKIDGEDVKRCSEIIISNQDGKFVGIMTQDILLKEKAHPSNECAK